MSRRALLLIAFIALAPGCSLILADPDETQVGHVPADTPGEETRLRGQVAENPDDLGVRFALARRQEQNGLLEAASLNYGIVAQGLPAGRFTRPWLAYARVELALDRDRSAQHALENVLAVVPDDESWYQLNADYRDAALLLAPLLAREGKSEDVEKLRARFVDQLGGEPEEWPIR